MAKPLIAGNWKMYGNAASANSLASQLARHWDAQSSAEMIVFPPAVHLATVALALSENGNIAIGAQNLSQHDAGAYTGEISAAMLTDLGCGYVLVGHSERRTVFTESNGTVAEKFKAAQAAGLTPILCVGETLQQRQQVRTMEVVAEQIAAVVEQSGLNNVCRAVIAYEPVWAIGTGETASPEQAQQVHSAIRAQLGEAGLDTTLLYGGSVKAENAIELFSQPDINGGLVGGASLEANEFLNIAQQLTEQE
ncbi:MAG: triose-phosphate isomerase [Porticoccaceae bacterium]|jgi:triosephosphate isomerase (TIM)|nr:triose-phosphate isomerase [Porticoccaceae bacterium]MDG1310841.1 triose-phosphate isomerase [Porticoccaceae bacterium]